MHDEGVPKFSCLHTWLTCDEMPLLHLLALVMSATCCRHTCTLAMRCPSCTSWH